MTELGKRLRALRKAQNLTQQDVAVLSGVNIESIRGYETRGVDPSLTYAAWIADALEVSTDFLAGLEDPDFLERIESARKPQT